MDNSQGQLFPASLLQDIQSRFAFVDTCPFLGRRVFLDSASGSLRLREVGKIMEREACLPDQINRDTPGSHHVMDAISRGEDDVRLFLGSPGTVVPALTSTLALSRTIRDAVAHFPGGTVWTLSLVHPRQPRTSPQSGRVGSHAIRFGACSAFTHVTACDLPPEFVRGL